MTSRPGHGGKEQTAGASEKSHLGRIEAVYFEVAALGVERREEAIARLCAGDSTLEKEVRSLLGVAGRMSDFLERPALGVGVGDLTREAEARDPLIGGTLGAFRVEKRIASGGMGTVYLAARSDGQFDQKVAIKVVKRGMDSEEILRRFRVERQTLASLDHPNIARLLDGGATEDGRPFVVMEYVDGVPIDEYCDGKSLSLRERLVMFREVCEAVHHAHQNLIIHRDIKPSNILVTKQGVPKLLDFGIAKVISGDSRETVTHTSDTERRLTPEFASPEQVEGGTLTTASDVYSLGVVLYELLTGIRPYYFGVRTSEEVRRVVCTQMPLAPSRAITVKASRMPRTGGSVEGVPAQSAERTSGGTTGDGASGPAKVDVPKTRGVSSTRLRGLLRGDLDVIVLKALRKEPQRRYASAEQFSADLGRYLSGMPVQARPDTLSYRASKFVRRHAAGVTVTVGVMVLLSGTSIALYRQGVQLERQQGELLAANDKLDQSIKRVEENRRFLQTVISGADASIQGPDARLGDVLKDAARTLRTAPPSDPVTQAASSASVGRAMMSLGMLDEASELLLAADGGYAHLSPDDEPRLDTRQSLAQLKYYRGDYAAAEAEFRSMLADERARNGGKATRREGELLNDLGAAVRMQNRFAEAAGLQREAIEARTAVHGGRSLEVAESRNNLASALLQDGKLSEAAGEFRAVLELRTALLRPEHPLIVRCKSNLGLAQHRLKQHDEAIQLLTEAVASWDRAFGPRHPGRIAAMKSLALALGAKGRMREAVETLRAALAWQRENQPDQPTQISATEANLGIALADAGQTEDAVEYLERALPELRTHAADAPITSSVVKSLIGLYEKLGREEDVRRLRESVKSGEK